MFSEPHEAFVVAVLSIAVAGLGVALVVTLVDLRVSQDEAFRCAEEVEKLQQLHDHKIAMCHHKDNMLNEFGDLVQEKNDEIDLLKSEVEGWETHNKSIVAALECLKMEVRRKRVVDNPEGRWL